MKEVDPSKEALSLSCSAIGRSRYKLWVLVAILLLAFWSVLSGSAWIAGKSSDAENFGAGWLREEEEYQFDVLDLELREKLARHMWDKYRQNPKYKLNSFWQVAFEAAFEEMDSESPAVKQAAVTEIAKLSTQFFDVDPRTKKPKYKPERLPH